MSNLHKDGNLIPWRRIRLAARQSIIGRLRGLGRHDEKGLSVFSIRERTTRRHSFVLQKRKKKRREEE